MGIAEGNYIIITLAKDEAAFISDLIDSIKNQSVKPSYWVIVNDGSTDGTAEILDKQTSHIDWIDIIHMPAGERQRGQHVAYLDKTGIDHAVTTIDKWDFIGFLDADIVFEYDYYEKLIGRFNEDEHLGLASGGIYVNGKLERTRYDEPRGACVLIRRECFDDIERYKVYDSPYAAQDSINKAKAKMNGWKVRHFEDIRATEQRPTGDLDSAWQMGKHWANVMHYFGYSHFLRIGAIFALLVKPPHYPSIAYALTYAMNIFERKERIPDEEVFRYFRYEKLKAIRKDLRIYFRR